MSHSGDCRADVEYHLSLPKFQKQFKKIDQALIFEELKEYGAWNAEKLADTRMNQIRILWIAATVTHYFAKLDTPGKTIVITHDYFTGRSIFKVRNSADLLKHTKHDNI